MTENYLELVVIATTAIFSSY